MHSAKYGHGHNDFSVCFTCCRWFAASHNTFQDAAADDEEHINPENMHQYLKTDRQAVRKRKRNFASNIELNQQNAKTHGQNH